MSSKPPRAPKQQAQDAEQELIGTVLDEEQEELNPFLKQLRSKMSPKDAKNRQPRAWKLQEAPSSNYGSSPKNGVSLFHSNSPTSQRQQFWGATPGNTPGRSSIAGNKPQTPASSRGSGNSGTPPGSAAGRTWAKMASGGQGSRESKPDSPNNFRKQRLAMEAVRPRSAPPKLTETPAKEPIHREDTPSLYIGGEKIAPDDYRLSPTYYAYYYSQRPLDPRLPKPLFDWSAWTSPQGTNSTFKPFHLPGRGTKNGFPRDKGLNNFETPSKNTGRSNDYNVPTPVQGPPHPLRQLEGRMRTFGRHSSHWKQFYDLHQAARETKLPLQDIENILSQLVAGSDGTAGMGSWEFRLAGSRAGEHGLDMRGSTGNYGQDPGVQNYGISGQYNGERGQHGVPPIHVDANFRQPGEAQQLHNRMARLQLHSQNSPSHSPIQGPFGNHGMGRNNYGVPPTLGYGGYSPVGVAPYSPSPMMAMMGYGTKDGEEVSNPNVPQLAAQYSPVTTPIVATSLPPPLGVQYSPSGATILTAQYSPQAGPMPTMLPPSMAMAQQYQQTPGQMGHSNTPGYGSRNNYGGGNTNSRGRRNRDNHNQGGGERSQLLAELRAQNMNRQPTLMDVVNQQLVTELSMDQNGSRFIQQRLEHATQEEKEAVFQQILPETIRLCTDVFGNYVIQKFFEFGAPQHKRMLAECLEERVLPLSLQMYGCRVIQKALELSSPEHRQKLSLELKDHVLSLVRDQNGNHVIQKIIEKSPAEEIQFIVEAFKLPGVTRDLATHSYGCRVIQRLMERVLDANKVPLLEEILRHTVELCMDQYGNYVVQHILDHAAKEWRAKAVRAIRGHIKAFGMHKFASNVVEKCFQLAEGKDKEALLQEILGKGNESPLTDLVRDQYGNYVVQKILASVSGNQRARLIRRITAMVPNIRKIAYGKHIISKIEKLTGKSYQG